MSSHASSATTSTNTSSPPSNRSEAVRRWTCGLALIMFPALLLGQAVITPDDGGGEAMYAAATEHRSALLLSATLLIVSGILMAPAAAGILSLARRRGSIMAIVGAVLAVPGGTGHIALGYFYIMSAALPGGDRGEMIAYVDRIGASSALMIFVFPLLLCFGLAVIAMPWAAYRAGAVGRWAPITAAVAFLIHEGLPPEVEFQDLIGIVVLAVLTVVHGYLGLIVLRARRVESVRTPALGEAHGAETTRLAGVSAGR
ncbi:MAG: hypothetical protein H5T81_07780 [Tetrasphaera sp.]|nr:hypothetical protein [Tetrasphaera sp.]